MQLSLFVAVAWFTQLLLSPASFAGTNGEELKLSKKSDGKYSFGVSYAYDEDFGWRAQFATEIAAKDLGALPNKVKWNVFNSKTGKFLAAWTETEKRTLKLGGVSIDDKRTVKEVLVNQADLQLVFGVENAGKVEPKYYLPIGEFCKKDLTDYFKNLTDGEKRCDQIKDADVRLPGRGGRSAERASSALRRENDTH